MYDDSHEQLYIYENCVLYKFCQEDEKKYNKTQGRHMSIGTY